MNKKHVLDLLAMQASLIQTVLLAHMKDEHLSETDLIGLCIHGYEFLVTEQGHEFDPVMGSAILKHVKNVNDQLTKNPYEYEKEIQKEVQKKFEEKAENKELSEEEIVQNTVAKLCDIFGIDPDKLPS